MTDPRTDQVLVRLYPLNRARNADGLRRSLQADNPAEAEPVAQDGIAPLLRKLIQDYAATGLPPAYLPQTTSQENHDD